MIDLELSRRRAFAGLAALAAGAMHPSASPGRVVSDRYRLPPGTERICLSLRVLAAHAVPGGVPSARPSAEATSLAGLGRLEGYYVDRTGPGDLVLFGRRSSAASLHLDELSVLWRNIIDRDRAPGCSLDPRPENLRRLQSLSARTPFTSAASAAQSVRDALGPQQVIVHGVPRNSRPAHIMIDADYHMKRVSQGLVRLPGVSSCLDLAVARGGVLRDSMSRFWFHLAPSPDLPLYSPIFEQDQDTVWLDQCPVVLMTEKQAIAPSGIAYDVGQDDPVSRDFAAAMTRLLTQFDTGVPVYNQLVNLYRLRALLLAIHFRGHFRAAGLDPDRYLVGYRRSADRPMPDSLPAISNHRVLRSGHVAVVCGGVGQEMHVGTHSFQAARTGWLPQFLRMAQRHRPTPDTLAWRVAAAG